MSRRYIIGKRLIARAVEAGACVKALEWLREKPRTLDALIEEQPEWAEWAVDVLCRAEARRVYYAAAAEARRVYYAAAAEARRVYEAAMAEPRRVYEAAMAEPRRAYEAAMAEALRAALVTLWGAS